MKRFILATLLAGLPLVAHAETLTGLCMVSVSRDVDHSAENSELVLRQGNCEESHDCNSSDNSHISWSRWTGLSANTLAQEGAQLDARITADAGELRCTGTVHDAVLAGRYNFTPNTSFQQQMTAMGFENVTAAKLQGFLLLDITLTWVRQMKNTGVTDLTTGHLMGLRALHVTPEYIRAMAEAGYPELGANKLTEMKAVGVTPEKAKEAKALGFQPNEQELIQMSIFKIDRPFIEHMRAKGLTNLTVAKLIQVKIFKLDE
jgi:hypothetical protein